MKWTREPDGYRSGRYFCQRHEVDDREYDGGYRHTYWNLYVGDEPIQQHVSLAACKRDAETIEAVVVRNARPRIPYSKKTSDEA